MIASDYLRCAPSDVELKKRYEQVRYNVTRILQDKLIPVLTWVEAQEVADHFLAHMQLNCYTPE